LFLALQPLFQSSGIVVLFAQLFRHGLKILFFPSIFGMIFTFQHKVPLSELLLCGLNIWVWGLK